MEIGKVAMPAANALDQIAGAAFGPTRYAPGSASGGAFASLIQQSLAQVDAAKGRTETSTQRWQPVQGGVSREDAMRSMQTGIGQATLQIRDQLVAAYNDIMNMPL